MIMASLFTVNDTIQSYRFVATKPIVLRSINYKGPQPGKLATVFGISEVCVQNQWLDCYLAKFDNGEEWVVPLMAIKDYERIR